MNFDKRTAICRTGYGVSERVQHRHTNITILATGELPFMVATPQPNLNLHSG